MWQNEATQRQKVFQFFILKATQKHEFSSVVCVIRRQNAANMFFSVQFFSSACVQPVMIVTMAISAIEPFDVFKFFAIFHWTKEQI